MNITNEKKFVKPLTVYYSKGVTAKKIITIFFDRYILILAFIITLFSLIYGYYALVTHLSFLTHAFDLGIYTQISWLYSQNETSFSSIKHMPLLADHFEPILWIFSPVYRLFPSPTTLLIMQSLFVSLSAVPLYFISLHKTKSKTLSLVLILSYLTSTGIVNAIKFEFHTTTLSVLPLSLILFAWTFNKWKLYIFSLLFGYLIKEDISFILIGLGLYQIFIGQRKTGLITAITSAAYFFSVKFFLMPFIWPGSDKGYITTSLLPLTSPVDIVLLALIKPTIFFDIFFNSSVKQHTFTTIYQPFAYLALLSPLNWLTAIPSLYLRFSSTAPHFWTHIFHYNANLMPFILTSTVFAIKQWRIPPKPLIILFTILLFLTGLSPNSIVWNHFKDQFQTINFV